VNAHALVAEARTDGSGIGNISRYVAVPLWVARLIVSQKTAEKLAGRHELDWHEGHDAVVCVAGLQ
jgi:hypothetical protein